MNAIIDNEERKAWSPEQEREEMLEAIRDFNFHLQLFIEPKHFERFLIIDRDYYAGHLADIKKLLKETEKWL